jgi:kumamolisin
VHIPADLKDIITGVFGLDGRRQARHHGQIHPLPPATSRASTSRPWFVPSELAPVYGFPSADGAGQCIGLLEFGGGYNESDLATYFSEIQVNPAPHVLSVPVGHAANRPGVNPDEDGEVMLDIEVAGALAPRAALAVYFSTFTEKGWIDALTAAVHDNVNKPTVLSISWGYAEGNLIWTQQAIDNVNQTLEEAAHLGVTVCVASGDDGSSDDVEDGHAHVDFPASSPCALAVGGTTLKVSGQAIQSEVVWNGGPRATADGAGGGGVSSALPLPSWQDGIVPPSVNPGHATGRGVPDVAAVADPRTGYYVRSSGQSGVAGGTSAAAPLWAALIARINQLNGVPAGYLTPLLYNKQLDPSTVCHDIVVGDNDTQGLVGGYRAGPGWDACTGWGSPSGGDLATGLKGTAHNVRGIRHSRGGPVRRGVRK